MSEHTDFRDKAVAASQNLLRKKAKPGTDPMHAGISCCLPGIPNGIALRARHRSQTIRMVFLALLLVLAAGVVIPTHYIAKFNTPTLIAWGVGGALVVLGVSLLFIAPGMEKRFVESNLRTGAPAIWQDSQRPHLVRIENAETYKQFKFVPDDFGALVLHNDSRCVQIEGMTHRYLIYGADVAALKVNRVEPTESFNIAYQIGGERLELTIVPMEGHLLAAVEDCLGVSR